MHRHCFPADRIFRVLRCDPTVHLSAEYGWLIVLIAWGVVFYKYVVIIWFCQYAALLMVLLLCKIAIGAVVLVQMDSVLIQVHTQLDGLWQRRETESVFWNSTQSGVSLFVFRMNHCTSNDNDPYYLNTPLIPPKNSWNVAA